MSFFEKAKAAASDLAAKADVAMTNAGVNVPGMGGDKALRDLGVIAWMDATGRPVADADRQRVMATLGDLESSGRLGPLTLTPPAPAYGTPPPPPGAAAAGAPAAPPPPPSAPASGPPPPPSTPQPPPAPPAAPPAPPEPPQGGTPPPPPPPSWA